MLLPHLYCSVTCTFSAGQKELNVFVDLAMMSAGDEPMNIKKVQCLHSAVLGYSPLIFDIDGNCDYMTLLDKCKVVWKELDTNPNLPKQLVGSQMLMYMAFF
ncbi:hypothetical protein DPMN_054480 [Dreissena polymorpha]|uniref:Uncharacterized protein n=1 Tax=Dreissena polymorpha TaxID=45954 RepID=A0A9D4CN74_DREPO|nr:hypothetical protein DPMN_054480 [Dreissena polymorpha]